MPTGIPRTRTVRIEPYSSQWPQEYAAERERILAAVGNRIDAIEHVGSTAIPGMCAKPVIDIAVAIRGLELAETLVSGMATIGYDYLGDIGLPNQRIFGRAPEIRTHLVHVVTTNGDEWHRYLHFREVLRADAAIAREYAALKRELADRFPLDRGSYTAGKGTVIERVLASRWSA